MTVLDLTTIATLRTEAESSDLVVTFLRRYRILLPRRVKRLAEAVAAGDVDTGLDAALSLKVSSAMLGAVEVSTAAREIQGALEAGDLETGETLVDTLPAAADRLEAALGALLSRVAPRC